MAGSNDLFEGLDRLNNSITQLKVGQAISGAQEKVNQIRGTISEENKQKTALQQTANDLVLQLAKLNANPAQINAASEGVVSKNEADISKLQTQGAFSLLAAQLKNASKAAKDSTPRYVNGFGYAPDAPTARKFRPVVSQATNGIAAVDELISLGNKPMAEWKPAVRAKASVLQAKLVGLLRIPFTGGGPLTDQEKDEIRLAAANPTEFLQVTSKDRLQQLKKVFQDQLKYEAESIGFTQDPNSLPQGPTASGGGQPQAAGGFRSVLPNYIRGK